MHLHLPYESSDMTNIDHQLKPIKTAIEVLLCHFRMLPCANIGCVMLLGYLEREYNIVISNVVFHALLL